MVSVASGGAADRIAMRILLKVLRAGSGIPARYSSTFFGAPLAFAAELGPPDFTFFMPEMLQKLPLQVHPQPPYVPKSSHRGSPDYALYRQTATESVEPQCHHGVHARFAARLFTAHARLHLLCHRALGVSPQFFVKIALRLLLSEKRSQPAADDSDQAHHGSPEVACSIRAIAALSVCHSRASDLSF